MSDLEASLYRISASEAVSRFREGSLSPVAYLDALIARIEAVEPSINAVTYRYFDFARDQARYAADRYAQKAGDLRPLEGVPIAVKDSTDLMGMPHSMGSLTLKDHVAQRTSFVNQRLLDAGAIVHLRTTTPEFSCAAVTHSRQWGITRNPWNPDYTSGGSSGGAGAVLATGMAPLATGSDIGGSIRIPASCCGVVGYKPPHGRNPMDPPLNLDPYCHSGPMARSVRDTLLLQNVMVGPHPGDITTLSPKLELSLSATGSHLTDMRIAYSPDLGFYEVDPAVRANMQEALDTFRALGATVETVALPWTKAVEDAAIAHLRHVFGTSLGAVLASAPELMTDYARDFAQQGLASRPQDLLDAMRVEAQMYPSLSDVFTWADLLICPTTALPAVPAAFNHLHDKVTINGREVNAFLGWVMTPAFNMLSRCPVLSVPTGLAPNNVPTGMQIVGRPYADQSVFDAALAFEAASAAWSAMRGKDPIQVS